MSFGANHPHSNILQSHIVEEITSPKKLQRALQKPTPALVLMVEHRAKSAELCSWLNGDEDESGAYVREYVPHLDLEPEP